MALLDPNTELDIKDKRAIEASFRKGGLAWWDGLPENTRRVVMGKLLNALSKAESARDIGTITRSLMMADRLDLERERLEVEYDHAKRSENHLHLHAGPSEMFKELIQTVQTRDAVQPARADHAAAEPAVNDQ